MSRFLKCLLLAPNSQDPTRLKDNSSSDLSRIYARRFYKNPRQFPYTTQLSDEIIIITKLHSPMALKSWGENFEKSAKKKQMK